MYISFQHVVIVAHALQATVDLRQRRRYCYNFVGFYRNEIHIRSPVVIWTYLLLATFLHYYCCRVVDPEGGIRGCIPHRHMSFRQA